MTENYQGAVVSQSIVSAVCDGADLLYVVGSSLPLKSIGKHYLGNCPFCGEEEFAVSEIHSFYHCFHCEASGTALTFLMAAKDMTFREAVAYLGKLQGLEFPEGWAK